MEKLSAINDVIAIPGFGLSALYLASKHRRDPLENGLLIYSIGGLIVSVILSAYRYATRTTSGACKTQRNDTGDEYDEYDEYDDADEVDDTDEEYERRRHARESVDRRNGEDDDAEERYADHKRETPDRWYDADGYERDCPVMCIQQRDDRWKRSYEKQRQMESRSLAVEAANGPYFQYNGKMIPACSRSTQYRRYYSDTTPSS